MQKNQDDALIQQVALNYADIDMISEGELGLKSHEQTMDVPRKRKQKSLPVKKSQTTKAKSRSASPVEKKTTRRKSTSPKSKY